MKDLTGRGWDAWVLHLPMTALILTPSVPQFPPHISHSPSTLQLPAQGPGPSTVLVPFPQSCASVGGGTQTAAGACCYVPPFLVHSFRFCPTLIQDLLSKHLKGWGKHHRAPPGPWGPHVRGLVRWQACWGARPESYIQWVMGGAVPLMEVRSPSPSPCQEGRGLTTCPACSSPWG